MVYLLDTNALVHLARQKSVGQHLKSELSMLDDTPIIISSISLGEVQFFGLSQNWHEETIKFLMAKISRSIVINPDGYGVAKAYAEIQYQTKVVAKPAHVGGENDVWVAACAMATGTCLVSSDKWFKYIGGKLIDLAFFDANNGAVEWLLRP